MGNHENKIIIRDFHPKTSLDLQLPIKKYRKQVESKIIGIHPTMSICEVRDLSMYDVHTLSLYQFQNIMTQVSCNLHSRMRACNKGTKLLSKTIFFFQALDSNYM